MRGAFSKADEHDGPKAEDEDMEDEQEADKVAEDETEDDQEAKGGQEAEV
jgi:hypothetical protein